MNIVYSSSEYYYKPTYVSVFSLLTNSREKHNIILLASDISYEKVKELETMVLGLGSNFEYRDITNRLENIGQEYNLPLMRGGYSTYARVFLSEILDDKDHVLVIDSDTLVLGDVAELIKPNTESVLLACRDYVVSNKYSAHEDPDLSANYYYNMGVVYMNLRKWRELGLSSRINSRDLQSFKLRIADQSLINRFLGDYIGGLDIKFNFYTYFHYDFNHGFYKAQSNGLGFMMKSEFYSAKSKPIILHFIGTWYERPWFKYNISPYKKIYLKYWSSCFPIDQIFEIPKLGTKSISYDISSLLVYWLFGRRMYFAFRYRLVQGLKKLIEYL